MAHFKEFIAVFKTDYSEEERRTYRAIYEDESQWPGADEDNEGRITIDLDYVVAFNEYSNNKTTVDITGGSRFTLKVSYEDFKKQINAI